MNALPKVDITRTLQGWLTACTCGWEAFHAMRPSADLTAHRHRAEHQRKGK